MSSKNRYINAFRKVLLIVAIVSLFQTDSIAQVYSPYVKDFKAQAIDGKLYLSWTTRAGFTCTDIHIEVSRDSLDHFERKGTYYGVCGDASEKDYTYVLDNPIYNSLNYLKLQLGNYGYSYVISELVIYVQSEVLILPHPATTASVFHFKNKSNDDLEILFYSSNGELITTIHTIEESINLSNIHLKRGFIIYEIRRKDAAPVRGKFLVASIF